jgi:hypothetical protein
MERGETRKDLLRIHRRMKIVTEQMELRNLSLKEPAEEVRPPWKKSKTSSSKGKWEAVTQEPSTQRRSKRLQKIKHWNRPEPLRALQYF